MARLQEQYKTEIAPHLMETFKYKNVMQVPRLEKIVLNIGVSTTTGHDTKAVENAARDLGVVTGQKAVITRAKKSIANFRLRDGMEVGCKVTLRGQKMYEFLDRFINISIPRIRDFRGLSPNSFDGRGNYATGIKEQLIFPEIDYDQVDKIRGMDIIIVTTAFSDVEGRELLKGFGMPFTK